VNTLGPRACYDEGKRAAETLFMDYRRCHKVDTRIARIFNTYGPGMHPYDGRVVSNFIRQAQAGEPLTIYGSRRTRSFCFRDDLIEGLIRLMNSDVSVPVNLGNPAEKTVYGLALQIRSMTNSESDIEIKQALVDDPIRRCPDISRAIEKLGWGPKIDLTEGLTRTIDWFGSVSLGDYRAPTPNY